jgi:hypothetical protein
MLYLKIILGGLKVTKVGRNTFPQTPVLRYGLVLLTEFNPL